MQIDLATTGLGPGRDRIFMLAVRDTRGADTLEARDDSDVTEAELIRSLIARADAEDPDVIENHNLHGRRARLLDVHSRSDGSVTVSASAPLAEVPRALSG
jgi:DNA polymerase I